MSKKITKGVANMRVSGGNASGGGGGGGGGTGGATSNSNSNAASSGTSSSKKKKPTATPTPAPAAATPTNDRKRPSTSAPTPAPAPSDTKQTDTKSSNDRSSSPALPNSSTPSSQPPRASPQPQQQQQQPQQQQQQPSSAADDDDKDDKKGGADEEDDDGSGLSRSQVQRTRRRLSVLTGDVKKAITVDGVAPPTSPVNSEEKKDGKRASVSTAAGTPSRRACTKFSALTKTGMVPFNPNKVNQDRAAHCLPFNGNDEMAFFGVFDGHGSLGHEVSSFVATELPKFVAAQKNLETEPIEALTKAFVDCNTRVCGNSSSIDCTFSGTTAIVVFVHGRHLYSCNAGDSRAVLAKRLGNGKMKAVPLSRDHKPELKDEKKRIVDSHGRVEACKGPKGEDIGPPRVWLLHQDVPGLAMTRSFGDKVAASVGVTAKPEVWERTIERDDAFMILASDGVWEFISSQEAVDLVTACKTPEAACRILVDESVKRWQREEEVVDDITAVVAWFAP